MGKIIESPLTDERLKEQGIMISEEETETVFFDWFEKMEEEVFGEDEEWKALQKNKKK